MSRVRRGTASTSWLVANTTGSSTQALLDELRRAASCSRPRRRRASRPGGSARRARPSRRTRGARRRRRSRRVVVSASLSERRRRRRAAWSLAARRRRRRRSRRRSDQRERGSARRLIVALDHHRGRLHGRGRLHAPARPSSSTASRVTAAVTRNGPGLDLDERHHAVDLDRAHDAREAVAGRERVARSRGGAGAARAARPPRRDAPAVARRRATVRSLPRAVPAAQRVDADADRLRGLAERQSSMCLSIA